MLAKSITINANDFYEKGFSETFVLANRYRDLKKAIDKTLWTSDPDGIYNRVPSWRFKPESAGHMGESGGRADKTLECCPQDVIEAIEGIIKDRVITGSIGAFFSFKLDFIDLWDGVESTLGWHWDGPDQSSVISIIYLNEATWPVNGGGDLAVGVRDLSTESNWLNEYLGVQEIERIKPAGRTQVWLNNMCPRFVHRPIPLFDQTKQRIALTFGCSLIPIQ